MHIYWVWRMHTHTCTHYTATNWQAPSAHVLKRVFSEFPALGWSCCVRGWAEFNQCTTWAALQKQTSPGHRIYLPDASCKNTDCPNITSLTTEYRCCITPGGQHASVTADACCQDSFTDQSSSEAGKKTHISHRENALFLCVGAHTSVPALLLQTHLELHELCKTTSIFMIDLLLLN